MKRQSSKPIARSRGQRSERRRILIVTEGTTEVQYIQGLVQYLKATGASVRSVNTQDAGGRDPSKILNEAIRLRRVADDIDPYDDVWLVVDVDDHGKLPDCLRDAKRNNVYVAVSNPCFEIWLLWHFEITQKFHDAKLLARALRKYGQEGKHLKTNFPFGNYVEAYARSKTNCDSHSIICKNPSSAMRFLVDALKFSRPSR